MDRFAADIEKVERDWLRAVAARRRLIQFELLERIGLLSGLMVALGLAVAGDLGAAGVSAGCASSYAGARFVLQRLSVSPTSADAALLHERLSARHGIAIESRAGPAASTE